jgi:hypothetical protein
VLAGIIDGDSVTFTADISGVIVGIGDVLVNATRVLVGINDGDSMMFTVDVHSGWFQCHSWSQRCTT